MTSINFITTRKSRSLALTAVVVLVLAGIFVAWQPAQAFDIGKEVMSLLNTIVFGLLSLLGRLLTVLIKIMIDLAQFNNFVDVSAVKKGWVVVRDLCNVGLILVLLVISWGTVLRIETYHYKRSLPKFILMAFLINFSKSIAGFFIDICQVVMHTFVKAFASAAASNLTTGAGLQNILNFSAETGNAGYFQPDLIELLIALALGIFLLVFMIGAVLMIIFILLGRIIVLWILVATSPMAYLGETIGPLKKLASDWWSTFGKYATVGPMIAFYLWLAMAVLTANPGNAGKQITQNIKDYSSDQPFFETGEEPSKLAVTISAISNSDNLTSYLLTVGLLYAAVMAAQSSGTMGAAMGAGIAKGVAGATGKWLATRPTAAYAWGAKKIKAGALPKRFGKGIELNPLNIYKNLKEGMRLKGEKEEREGKIFAEERLRKGGLISPLTALGAPSYTETYMQGWFYNKGLKAWGRQIVQGKYDRALGKKQDEMGDVNRRIYDFDAAHQEALEKRTDEIYEANPDISIDEAKEQARAEIGGEEYAALRSQKESIASEVTRLKETISKYEAFKPRDFMAQQMRRAQDAEESKKYNTTSEEELIALMKGAIARGDLAAARAIFLQSARVSHENEVVNYSQRATEDYYEHHEKGLMNKSEFEAHIKTKNLTPEMIKSEFENEGQAIIRAGQQLPSGIQGMHAFVREVFVKKMKMDKQSAFALENDISNVAEQTGHWNAGQAIGTRSDGTLYQRSRRLQNIRVDVEMSKQDFETALRRFNRLGFMDEHLKDPTNPSSERYGKLTSFGAKVIADKWQAIASSIGKERFNVSNARHLVNDYNNGLLEGPILGMVRAQAESEQKNIDIVTRYYEANKATLEKEFASPEKFQNHYADHVEKNYRLFLSKLRDFAGKKGTQLDAVEKKVTQYAVSHTAPPEHGQEPPPVF